LNDELDEKSDLRTWWKSEDDESKRSRIWWKSVIRSSFEYLFHKHLLICKKIFFSVWQISKTIIWRWWLSESRELDENQKTINRERSRTWWKSVIRSSFEWQFRKHLMTCKENFSSV
jgi:hypothetical protein